LNETAEVNRLHEYLYYIQQKNYEPGSVEYRESTLALARWYAQAHLRNPEDTSQYSTNMQALRERDELVLVYDSVSNTYRYVHRSELYRFGGGGLGRESLASQNDLTLDSGSYLDRSRQLYESVLESVANDDRALRISLLYELANVSYQIKIQAEFLESTLRSSFDRSRINVRQSTLLRREYRNGLSALEEVLDILATDPQTSAAELAKVQLDIADWHLSFAYHTRANEAYQLAHSTLTDAVITAEEIASYLTPEPVLFIPVFATQPNSRQSWGLADDAEVVYQGHVDLALVRDSYGRFRNITVTEMSENTDRSVRDTIIRQLSIQRSRPAFGEGASLAAETLSLRYYYFH